MRLVSLQHLAHALPCATDDMETETQPSLPPQSPTLSEDSIFDLTTPPREAFVECGVVTPSPKGAASGLSPPHTPRKDDEELGEDEFKDTLCEFQDTRCEFQDAVADSLPPTPPTSPLPCGSEYHLVSPPHTPMKADACESFDSAFDPTLPTPPSGATSQGATWNEGSSWLDSDSGQLLSMLYTMDIPNTEVTPVAAPTVLMTESSSGVYVLSRIIHPLGRPNKSHLQELFKTSLRVVFKRHKKKLTEDPEFVSEYVQDKVHMSCFGDTSSARYAHPVLKEVLRRSDKKLMALQNFSKIVSNQSHTYLVYCTLNENFSYKSLTAESSEKNHIILIQKGTVYCIYLKKSDNRNRRILAKSIIRMDKEGKLDDTSYIKTIRAVFKVVDL